MINLHGVVDRSGGVRVLPLTGRWDFRFNGDPEWRSIAVPGCWEEAGWPKDLPGPAWYRTTFAVPDDVSGQRLWIHFGAVSYYCEVSVNGQWVGTHIGLWDEFFVEITRAVVPGEQAELIVQVEKPVGPTRDRRSLARPGPFSLQETLTGFLPYVWGHIFGGIWQEVSLVITGRTIFEDIYVRGKADGQVRIEASLSAPAEATLAIRDAKGRVVFEGQTDGIAQIAFEVVIPEPQPWSPYNPVLYEADLRIPDGDHRLLRFGLRTLSVEGSTILLNGEPVYPRMLLSWGWYVDSLYSNPGAERIRADFERARSLGYNGVKLCLWFPPQYYFDLADEVGMLLWVEFPMWLPEPSEFWYRQVPLEYTRLARLARNHPSVILYSLGCELGSQVPIDVLGALYHQTRAIVGDALVRDNSGSGELYGGSLNEFADYYDHHFYADLQFYRALLDTFSPRWRSKKPWLLGEFNDRDTFRDLRRIYAANKGMKPWWTLADPVVNPQGARWQFDVSEQEARLRANGFWERGLELERISEQEAFLARKVVLELVRTYPEVSGYVVTGEVDTPITTAGMWDDLGRVKFDPVAFCACNSDLVLTTGWDRRRTWQAGGDRPAYWDIFNYTSGMIVRPHLIVSYYGRARGSPTIRWKVAFPGEEEFASSEIACTCELTPGSIRELCVIEFVAPMVDRPRKAVLHAVLHIGNEGTENSWSLWFFPSDIWSELAPFSLIDPSGRLADLRKVVPVLKEDLQTNVIVTTVWTPEIASFVANGGRTVLLQAGNDPSGPVPTVSLPFWREAIKVIEPHPAWADFPHDGWVSLQFYSCATDYALDSAALNRPVIPILRRVDARTMAVHDYAIEFSYGTGRLIVSTLRFEGGLGDQATGISCSPAASYLLKCWVEYLQRS